MHHILLKKTRISYSLTDFSKAITLFSQMYMSTLFTLITDKSVFRFIYRELESKVIVWLMKDIHVK